jgi:hypothetical protein
MTSSPIESRLANDATPGGRAPQQPDRSCAESSRVGPQRETARRFVTAFAQTAALLLPANNPIHPRPKLKNEKIKKFSKRSEPNIGKLPGSPSDTNLDRKSVFAIRTEVNPTSDNYGARVPKIRIREKQDFRTNRTQDRTTTEPYPF